MTVTRPRLLLLPLLLGLLLLAPVATAEARRTVPQGFYGVMWDGVGLDSPVDRQEDQWSLMASSGVESVRSVFSWAAAQPTRRSLDFSRTDRLVALAARRQVELMPIILDTPRWARLHRRRSSSAPRRTAPFARFMRRLVRRYGPDGSFWFDRPDLPRRPITEWQLWNEPHFPNYWYTRRRSRMRWPNGYVRLLKSGYQAIKRVDPDARVVLAGLTGASWNRLRILYRLNARRYFDVAAVQTYTSPRGLLSVVRRVRGTMRRYRDGHTPMYLTEMSWPASKGRTRTPRRLGRVVASDRGMARRLAVGYRSIARRRKRYRVRKVYWYTWASGYRSRNIFDYAGLIRFRGRRIGERPALRAFRRSARRHQGCAKSDLGDCLP